jgi:hypothetical protein
MRIATTFLLLMLSLALTLQKVGVVAFYRLQKTYIAQTLCENKARPEMKCDGKCYLRKGVKSQMTAEEPTAPTNQLSDLREVMQQLTNIVLFAPAAFEPNLVAFAKKDAVLVFEEMAKVQYPDFEQLPTKAALSDIFHPPIA